MDTTSFSAQEWLRYTRHIQLKGFGVDGQRRLKKSRVLVVGMGGLGCPLASYLAAAGVGSLVLVDGDCVDLTNLQRQVLYSVEDIAEPKVVAARKTLLGLNPDINIDSINAYFSWDLAAEIPEIDLVIDCSDNFATRYLINDFCLQRSVPWIYASVNHYSGQSAFFAPGNACFRCLFPSAPENIEDCNSAGVVGTLPGLFGVIQANEAIGYLSSGDSALVNKLLLLDMKSMDLRKISLVPDSTCRCQSAPLSINAASDDYQFFCADKTPEQEDILISAVEFSQIRDTAGALVLDVRTDAERSAFHIGGVHIPLNTLDSRLGELPKNKELLCYCQSGVRSLTAASLLRDHGFSSKSLHGGLPSFLKSFLGVV